MKREAETKEEAGCIKIAFADDQTMIRTPIISYIESLGNIKVIIDAEDGPTLIRRINKAEEKPVLCIIDIMMPGMNGFETVAELKRRCPDMKFLAVSGTARPEFIIKMVLAGAHGFLTKNCHPGEIVNAVHTILKNGIYNTEHFTPRVINAVNHQRLSLPQLTEMELKLLRLSIGDHTYQEIATQMHTTAKSVEGYRNKLFQKLGVKTKVGLAMYAVRNGYVSIDTDLH